MTDSAMNTSVVYDSEEKKNINIISSHGRGLVYSSKVYDALPMIRRAHDELEKVEQETFFEIANIFLRHNVQEYLGLTLLHRHFKMSDDERLVENFVERGPPELYSFCTTCTGHDVISKSIPLKSADIDCASPHSWALSASGEILAYEFQVGDHPLQIPTAFVEQLATYLKEKRLLGLFGIHAMHRPGSEIDGVLIEINDPDGRTNIITNVPVKDAENEPVTHVLWAFQPPEKEGGPPIVTLACHCSGKCKWSEHQG